MTQLLIPELLSNVCVNKSKVIVKVGIKMSNVAHFNLLAQQVLSSHRSSILTVFNQLDSLI